jgi:hypothetical protein
MSRNALKAKGTAVKYEDPANVGTFIKIGEIDTITPPSLQAEFLDVSDLDSVRREKLQVMNSLSDGSFDVNYLQNDPAMAFFINSLSNYVEFNLRFVFPDAVNTYVQYLVGAAEVGEPSAAVAGKLKRNIKVTVLDGVRTTGTGG